MDKSTTRRLLFCELAGIVFIIVIGSLLHFTFELSGEQALVGVFSAVNESVWEHLKLAFWPALLFMLLEYVALRIRVPNFFVAKTVGAFLMVATIPTVFYIYTAITNESIFAIDIATFILAVTIGQIVSYKLLTYKEMSKKLAPISIVTLILLALIFVVFSFYPPHLPPFFDPVTGNYGIP